MNAPTPNIFVCNGAPSPVINPSGSNIVKLNYSKDDPEHLVNLKLPKFVDQVYYLPDRILDLMEIAAYIFAGDRWASRGPKRAVEFHTWSRSMHFYILVRDADFWNRPEIKKMLADALVFMTGDNNYLFEFFPGHSTPPNSLFDREEFRIESKSQATVALFSGGLDSLSGILQRLNTTNEAIYLISHQSGQPSTKRTQKRLFEALKCNYPGRVYHYTFECGLSKIHATEETQRTRAFLFSAIAFALSQRLSLNSFYAYENGITSLNLLRRQDLINARASRTTHPKTHFLISKFLSGIQGKDFKVMNPFWNLTKTDVFALVKSIGGENFIGSTVSCSKTFQRLETATHCGCCFQCVDRRLAAYASGLQEVDNVGIYSNDIFSDSIESPETKTTAIDYIRQAVNFATTNDDAFALDRLSELADIVDYIDPNESNAVDSVWKLCHRHGEQVISAIKVIRDQLDDLRYKVKKGSLLQLIADREYFKTDPRRLAERITEMLAESIPIAFKSSKPENEGELNNQISALLCAHKDDYIREFPTTMFALAKAIPDHEITNSDLLIEAKHIRKATTPSKASDGIAADLTKYPADKFILFVVYDQDRSIVDDSTYKKDIENKRDCLVSILR
jgi:7-cyano-7-deazaguanine synthase in queuosine biosynthesis